MIKYSQRGGASIVTVTFLSLFIVILTVAMSKLMTGELRHAIDLENNVKGYYQAESGIEESILALRKVMADDPGRLFGPDVNQNCDVDNVVTNFGLFGSDVFDPNPNITCRRIRTVSNFLDSTLAVGQSAHFDLTKKGFSTIELEWDTLGLVQNGSPLGFTSLQQGDEAPPFLEATRIEYDDVNPTAITLVNPSSIALKSLFFAPVTSGPATSCGPTINFTTCNGNGTDGGRVEVRCSTQPIYRCRATISNFVTSASKRTVLRLRPYFNPMHYTMKIVDSTGRAVDFVLDKAVLDVTAKTGDSYRRIQQEVSLIPRPPVVEAIFGDDKLCKDFNILNVGSGQYVDESSIPNDCRLDD